MPGIAREHEDDNLENCKGSLKISVFLKQHVGKWICHVQIKQSFWGNLDRRDDMGKKTRKLQKHGRQEICEEGGRCGEKQEVKIN